MTPEAPMIHTEAEGFALIVRELERLATQPLSDFMDSYRGYIREPFMCDALTADDGDDLLLYVGDRIAEDVRLRMRERIISAHEGDSIGWCDENDTVHNICGPRIIAAQWFALVAEEEDT